MITSPAFRGKRYAVLGLARSGLATVDALVASGAEVTAWDAKEEARAKVAGKALLADPLAIDLAGYAGVVVSPGVPLNMHPIAAKARAAGVPVIGDIELFALARASLPPHKVVGITGTNGKSTTTALVHHILKTAGVPTEMGGNIGLPILAQDPLPAGGVYVLELSSYQIDLTFSLDCDVAVLLNITPDHLDRYVNFEAYAASKMRLFQLQSETSKAVVVTDDEMGHALADSLRFNLEPSPSNPGVGWTSYADVALPEVPFTMQPSPRLIEVSEVIPINQSLWPTLQGPHNAQNARAAIAVCDALGVSRAAIDEGLRTYPGLPHRMERVAEKDGILFVNDSKATNPDSTAPALAAYPYIHWIVGGRAKTDSLGPCEAQLGHVRAAYTIGESGPMFFELLHDKVPMVEQSVTLDVAVKDAARLAKAGEVVLLSPACSSFDQFRDYEARGEAFRDAVGALS